MDGLKQLRCPHNWDFEKYPSKEEVLLKRYLDSSEEYEQERTDSTKYGLQVSMYPRFCLLSYERYRKEYYSDALNYLDKLTFTDGFMDKYRRVFDHVTNASRVFILIKTEAFEEAALIMEKLNGEKYSDIEEAGFKYVKCQLMMRYGEEAGMSCVDLMKSAINIVPDEAEFHYSLGVILGRIRHHVAGHVAIVPTKIEFDSLKKALSLRKDNPIYAITMARLYMDSRHLLPYKTKQAFNARAITIYRNLLEHHESLDGNCIARCVRNLMRLKHDPDLEEYAESALRKSDSTLVNHYIGVFYFYNHQYEKSLNCLKKIVQALPYMAGNVLLSVYRMNKNSFSGDIIDSYIKQWEFLHFKSTDIKRIQLYLSVSQFCLIVIGDLKASANYFNKACGYKITEHNYIYLFGIQFYLNYLSLLKYELIKSSSDDKIILEAIMLMEKLPAELFQNDTRHPLPSVSDLKKNLV